jgi:hypothetical protein
VLTLSAQTTISLLPGGKAVRIESTKSVEAIEYTVNGAFPHRYIDYGLPVILPGYHRIFPTHGEVLTASVTSVAYSDGSSEGSGTAAAMVKLREQVQHGGPAYPDVCSCNEVLYNLVRQYRAQNPGKPDPELVSGPRPAVVIPYFLLPVTMVGFLNAGFGWLPVANGVDWAGNPEFTEAVHADAALMVNAFATCPLNVLQRGKINVSSGNADWCPIGTPGWNATLTVNAQVLYGPTGIGSNDKTQRWGLLAGEEIDFGNGNPVIGTMADSCTIVSPEFGGNGPGFGGCQQPN